MKLQALIPAKLASVAQKVRRLPNKELYTRIWVKSSLQPRSQCDLPRAVKKKPVDEGLLEDIRPWLHLAAELCKLEEHMPLLEKNVCDTPKCLILRLY